MTSSLCFPCSKITLNLYLPLTRNQLFRVPLRNQNINILVPSSGFRIHVYCQVIWIWIYCIRSKNTLNIFKSESKPQRLALIRLEKFNFLRKKEILLVKPCLSLQCNPLEPDSESWYGFTEPINPYPTGSTALVFHPFFFKSSPLSRSQTFYYRLPCTLTNDEVQGGVVVVILTGLRLYCRHLHLQINRF